MFQLASDIDDTVEEKLLIGDRPKVIENSENKHPLKERLPERRDEELSEVRMHGLTKSLRLIVWNILVNKRGAWSLRFHYDSVRLAVTVPRSRQASTRSSTCRS